MVRELQEYGVLVDVHDPWADAGEAQEEYGIDLLETPRPGAYGGIVIAVAHDIFRQQGAETLRRFGADGHVLYDLKYLFGIDETDLRL